VFPQLFGLGAQDGVDDAAAELAHHEAGDQGLQPAVANARDRGAHVGDLRAAAIEPSRIRQRDGTRRQLRFAQHETDRFFQMKIGIFQRKLEPQHSVNARGKSDFTAGGLGNNVSKGFESVLHYKIILCVTHGAVTLQVNGRASHPATLSFVSAQQCADCLTLT